MSTTYNFIICQHPIDGMRLALRSFNKSAERRLALLTRDAEAAILFLGHWCPPDYLGLAGLLRFDVEQLSIPVQEQGQRVHVVCSSRSGAERPHSELLDRLRLRLGSWGSVNVVLHYPNLDADLPPLHSRDQIVCLWQIQDIPGPEHEEAMALLRERISSSGSSFHGLRFYSRAGTKSESDETRHEQIKQLLKENRQEKLMLL
ncbi:MAG: hypothetical protein SNJ84_01540 [Verrucomicrobiia bacterium]